MRGVGKHLYSLKNPKLRQSWNKFNLYNLFRKVGAHPSIVSRHTFFQQKWKAKSRARAYHGEHIQDKKWQRLFSRRLMSAVDMPPEYLAAHDGSEQAAGRGSGLSTLAVSAESYSRVPQLFAKPQPVKSVNDLISKQHKEITPYMQMTYAPLERRLDTAIFRAMFATSVRQARQFVVHGAVKVNGKKMAHAGYKLNPGDMFQVKIDHVLYATGHSKSSDAGKALSAELEARGKDLDSIRDSVVSTTATGSADGAAAADGKNATGDSTEVALSENAQAELRHRQLKYLVQRIQETLKDSKKSQAVNRHKFCLLQVEAKRVLSRPDDDETKTNNLIDELEWQLKKHSLLGENTESIDGKQTAPEKESRKASYGQKQLDKVMDGLSEELKEDMMKKIDGQRLNTDELLKLRELLLAEEENPYDETKPYLTPWEPRPFMAAFAFIPRYLEVNHELCAAVYLRHPVARKGRAEVPTPFSYLTSQLSHLWYLRRGSRSRL